MKHYILALLLAIPTYGFSQGVGINTTTPKSMLDVEGNAAIGATYSGTTAAPANGLIVEGNVGIGTSSPATLLQIGAEDNTQAVARITGGATGTVEGGELQIMTAADYDATYEYYVIDAWEDDLRIRRVGVGTDIILSSSGNLGIGTSSPDTRFHMSSTLPKLRISDSDAAADAKHWDIATNTANRLRFQAINDAGGGSGDLIELVRSGNVVSSLDFLNGATVKNSISTSGDSYFTSGMVAIGTTTPTQMLTVDGAGFFMASNTITDEGGQLFLQQADDGGVDWNIDIAHYGNPRLRIFPTGSGDVLNIEDGGNVGIGTNDPSQLLHAYSGTSVNIYAQGANSSALLLDDDDATANEQIFQVLNNNQQFEIRSLSDALAETHVGLTFSSNTGNVAVGADPTPFDFKVGGDGDMEIDDDAGTNSNLVFKYGGTEVGRIIGVSSGYMTIGSNSSTPHIIIASTGNTSIGNSDATPDATLEIIETGTTPFMISNGATGDGDFVTVSTSGNVGIGTSTPGQKLDVENGNIRIDQATAGTSDQWMGASSINGIVFDGSQGMVLNSSASLRFNMDSNNDNADNQKIVFAKNDQTTGSTELARFTEAGNLGIGDTSPDAMLEIAETGTIPFMISDGATGDGNHFIVKANGNVGIGTTTEYATLSITKDNTSARGGHIAVTGATNSNLRGYFGIDTDAATPYLAINFVEETVAWRNIVLGNAGAASNVGIGTTSPSQRLEVNGGIMINTATAQPTCNASTRGTFWFVQNGAGVKDQVEVCAKAADDTYAWRIIY